LQTDKQMEGQLNHKPYFHNETEHQKYPLFWPIECAVLQSILLAVEGGSN